MISAKFVKVDSSMSSKRVQIQAKKGNRCISRSRTEGYTYQVEYSILDLIQYLNMFLFACLPDSTSIGNNRENTCAVEEAEVVV